jgi:hypothetical protein
MWHGRDCSLEGRSFTKDDTDAVPWTSKFEAIASKVVGGPRLHSHCCNVISNNRWSMSLTRLLLQHSPMAMGSNRFSMKRTFNFKKTMYVTTCAEG